MVPRWEIQAKLVEVELSAIIMENGCGYARAIGHTTSVAVELWVLRDGINLCVELNLPNVLIELVAKLVVDLLQNDKGRSNNNNIIMAYCKAGLQKILRTRV